jgi:hypothetical protein
MTVCTRILQGGDIVKNRQARGTLHNKRKILGTNKKKTN